MCHLAVTPIWGIGYLLLWRGGREWLNAAASKTATPPRLASEVRILPSPLLIWILPKMEYAEAPVSENII